MAMWILWNEEGEENLFEPQSARTHFIFIPSMWNHFEKPLTLEFIYSFFFFLHFHHVDHCFMSSQPKHAHAKAFTYTKLSLHCKHRASHSGRCKWINICIDYYYYACVMVNWGATKWWSLILRIFRFLSSVVRWMLL